MSNYIPRNWRWLEADTIHETNSIGPWTISDESDNDVATFYSDENANGPKITHEQSIVNVRVGAAAPDALNAIRALRERVLAYRAKEDWPQAMRDALDAADAAICKANGA
jgi:hypothetical protein